MKHVMIALVVGLSLLPLFSQSEAEVGSIAQVKGKEIILKYSNAENPLRIDQLIHIVSSEGKAVVLKVTYPMQTSAKCKVVSGDASEVKSGVKVFDGDKVVEKKKDNPAEEKEDKVVEEIADKPAEEAVKAETDPYKVNPLNSHRYFVTKMGTWEEDEKEAVAAGGHLVTLNDSEEERWVRETFGRKEYFIIGITMKSFLKGWEWINGEPVVYKNWGHEQYGYADAAIMNADTSHGTNYGITWKMISKYEKFRGIAEIDK